MTTTSQLMAGAITGAVILEMCAVAFIFIFFLNSVTANLTGLAVVGQGEWLGTHLLVIRCQIGLER